MAMCLSGYRATVVYLATAVQGIRGCEGAQLTGYAAMRLAILLTFEQQILIQLNFNPLI